MNQDRIETNLEALSKWQDKEPNTLTEPDFKAADVWYRTNVLKTPSEFDKIVKYNDIKLDIDDVFIEGDDVVVSFQDIHSHVIPPRYRIPISMIEKFKIILDKLENK